jgi:hypothetical protein
VSWLIAATLLVAELQNVIASKRERLQEANFAVLDLYRTLREGRARARRFSHRTFISTSSAIVSWQTRFSPG